MSASVLSRYLDPEVLQRLAGAGVSPRRLVLGNLAGAHASPLHGFAVEFAGHREYVWGDDPKHIDWRVYFTREKYSIKQYEMETNFTCNLALDISKSMRYGDGGEQKLLWGSRLAAALSWAVVRQSDRVALATFDDRVRAFVPPGSSLAQVHRIVAALDGVDSRERTSLADCLTEIAGRIGRRELVFVISDFLDDVDPLEAALQRLRYQHHEVVLFHVLHHDEIEFRFADMIRFVGLEVDDEALLAPEDMRAAYLAALARHVARLDEICQRNRVERVPIDTSQSIGPVLADYLTQRARLLRR